MAAVLRQRLEKLACDFPLKDNYFAWQAFAPPLSRPGEAALPPYLRARATSTPSARSADRVAVHHASFTELLARQAGRLASTAIVLLDAQDWMTDEQLNALWTRDHPHRPRPARA